MKNIKLYEKLKEVKGKKLALLAGGILTGALVVAGCTTQVIVDPNTGEVTVVDPQPTEPEIIDTTDPVDEPIDEPVQDEIDIEALMPQFPMMNEDGSLYHPEKVTSDVFEAKVNDLWEKYATNDYDKCVIACNVAAVNNGDVFSADAAYMYFGIYGYDIETYYAKTFYERDWGNEEIPFSAYFLDERTAKEMDKFEETMRVLNDENTPEETKEKIVEKMKEQAKTYGNIVMDSSYSDDDIKNLPMGFWYEAALAQIDPSFVMSYEGDELYLGGHNVHYGTPVDESSYVINQQVYDMNIGRYEEYCEEWDNEIKKESQFTK